MLTDFDEHDNQQQFGSCETEGAPLFVNIDGLKFYRGVKVHNVTVRIGDTVRVKLEGDEEGGDESGFAQILAIYDDGDEVNGEGVQVEARWYQTPDELPAKRKKLFTALDNELVESDLLDDIPAGSIVEHIKIVQAAGQSRGGSSSSSSSSSHFVCRYLATTISTALQPVSQRTSLQRGLGMSLYQYAYIDFFPAEGGVNGAATGLPAADPYSNAIRKLHVSVVPDVLPCRVEERAKIYDILRRAIRDKGERIKPIYISGMPGTGKTATIKATVRALEKEAERKEIPHFQFVEINCLKLQSPADAYTLLWREISGTHASAKTAMLRLKEYFEQAQFNERTAAERQTIVCLVDELDFLVTRDEEVVYNFFNWPLLKGSNLSVVGIANVMDLPERLSPRVTSRVGLTMERMIFMAYTFQQINEILAGRLADLELKIFDKPSLEYVSRKAASVAGDLRAALKICQRTIELYRDQTKGSAAAAAAAAAAALSANNNTTSSSSSSNNNNNNSNNKKTMMALVRLAADEYRESPLLATVSRSCLLDKAILVVMWKQYKASGLLEMTVDVIWHRLGDLLEAAKNNPRITLIQPPVHIFDEAIERLVDQGILKRAGARAGLSQVGAARSGHVSIRAEMADVIAALNEEEDKEGKEGAGERKKHPLLDHV